MRDKIAIGSEAEARAVLGVQDRHARLFRNEYGVAVTVRNGELHLSGEDAGVRAARRVIEEVLQRYRSAGRLDAAEVDLLVRAGGGGPVGSAAAAGGGAPILRRVGSKAAVAPRTPAQQDYVQAMQDHPLVFSIGPAGTGKTYLAVAMAVRMLRDGVVRKLVLTRPAVEAGEKLGFLPGSFEAKVDPYLRPLYDALYDFVELAQLRKYAATDILEVAPLAYMRGRTLSDAFVILDEGQNTTQEQMKMFLTRMGHESRVVVTGDVTQIDLPRGTTSGLVHAARIMKDTEGIPLCYFSKADIIRHPLVQKIVDAYERDGA